MNVKIADLKNNLSRYLRRVREQGQTIIVFDRDQPVATLSPIERSPDNEWERFRLEALARAGRAGIKIAIPETPPVAGALPAISTRAAPDQRTDLKTVERLRKSKEY